MLKDVNNSPQSSTPFDVSTAPRGSTPPRKSRRGVLILLGLLLGVCLISIWLWKRFPGKSVALQDNFDPAQPAQLANWPWPASKSEPLHSGMTHWQAKSSDGTIVDLFAFDFKANPHLRFGLYDQDEDDVKPFDNVVRYWTRGVGQTVRQLNSQPGEVLLATNGLFFGYKNKKFNANGEAFHVAPVVLRGKVYYGNTNHRWSFGVKYKDGKPHFNVFHLPSRQTLEREFDYGGGGAQCLVKDGKPLKLQPFPKVSDAKMKQPVPSTPQEAGHIPIFDHMKTSRVSLAWSKDSNVLYWLFVKEPDTEAGSAVALRRGSPVAGGWTVSDLQRFWMALAREGKIDTAINSDAGDVAQMTYRRSGNQYVLVSPRWANAGYDRKVLTSDFATSPQGGAIMYFYLRDTAVRDNNGGVGASPKGRVSSTDK